MTTKTKNRAANLLEELAFSLEKSFLIRKIDKILNKASPAATLAALGMSLIKYHVIIMTQMADKENKSFEDITNQALTAIKADMMGSHLELLKEKNKHENN